MAIKPLPLSILWRGGTKGGEVHKNPKPANNICALISNYT